jgi:hypothetical protein
MPDATVVLNTLKGIAQLYKGAEHVSNRFLMKKIEAFCKEPQSELSKKFLESLSREKFEDLQDLLMHTLNSAESVLKSMYLRKLMNSLCEGKIKWLEFGKMNFILSQIYTFDLTKIAEFYYGDKFKIGINDIERFFTLGLLNHKTKYLSEDKTVTKEDIETKYEENDLGHLFIECILFEEKKKIAKQFADDQKKNWDNCKKMNMSFTRRWE